MKKIMIFTILFISLINGFAQQEGDYNPYKHSREEYNTSMREIYRDQLIEADDSLRNTFSEIKNEFFIANTDSAKIAILNEINKYNCVEIFDFMQSLLQTETSEKIKFHGIMSLATSLNKYNTEFLLQYKKEAKTKMEKQALAYAYCLYELYDDAIEVLDSFCDCSDTTHYDQCGLSYFMAGGSSAIKFFNDCFEIPKLRNIAALKLAELGVYDKTYPIILELLENSDPYVVMSGLYGLASIGDENAFRIIKGHTIHEVRLVAQTAEGILHYIKTAYNRRRY